MSIKGSSIVWLERALERGDLVTAWTTAFELPRLPLDHALALVVLTATDHTHPARYDAAARRWVVLYLTDARGPSLADLRALVDALDELPDLDAITTLAALCARLGYTLAGRTLDHLLPPAAGPPR
jgi:hypothetical protein